MKKKPPAAETAKQWRARFAKATEAKRAAMIESGLGTLAEALNVEHGAIFGELFGDLPDGTYGNVDGKKYLAGRSLKALFKRERARGNSANIVVWFTDGGRIRPDRFIGDGSDAYTDPATGDLIIDGMRCK